MEADMSDIQKKPQRFCLRWNNFHSNIVSAFESLRKEEDFVDVTLACDGGSIKAHKMILSACSPYFKDLLKDNPCQHPIVILRDVSFSQLESLLQFVYHGEVNVSHDQLPEFLRTAEVLRIRGLADDRQDSTGSPSPPSTPQNRQQSNPPTPSSPSHEQQPQNSKRIKLELTNDKSETHKEQIEPENLSMSNSDKVTQPKREVVDDYENYDDDNSLTEMDDDESKSLSGSLAPGNIAKMVNMMESYRHMAHSLNPALGHFGQFNSSGHLTAGFNPTCSSPIPGRNLASTPPGSGGGSDSETHRMMNQHRIRKPRTVFSPVQLNMLRSYFSQNQHPTSHEMQYLADKLFLQRGVVKVWFQNERAKIRRIIKQEPGSMVSNTSPDSGNSLSSVHDTNHSQEQEPLMSSNWTPHNSGTAQALSLNPHNTSASQSQSLNPNGGSTQPLNLNLGTNHVPSNSNSEPLSEDEDEVGVKREGGKQNETE